MTAADFRPVLVIGVHASPAQSHPPAARAVMLLEVDQVAEQVQVVGRDHVVFLEQSDVSLPSPRLGDVVPQHVLQPDPVELQVDESERREKGRGGEGRGEKGMGLR